MQADELTRLADTLETAAADAGICVTITLPTHRHAPANERDPILLRGLIADAHAAIDAWQLERADRMGIKAQLDALEHAVAEQVGFNRTDLGLACYLTPTSTTVVKLGHTPPERVIAGVTFHMASVIADVSGVDDVEVIVLSSGGGGTEGARLYHLAAGELTRIGGDFPHESFDLGPPPRITHSKGTATERRRAEDFMRRFDDHVTELLGAEHSKRIVLVGTRRLRDKWRSVARHAHTRAVIAEIEGNHDKTSDTELAALVSAEVGIALEARILTRISDLDGLPTARLSISNDDIAASAESGNLAELYVEEGSTEPVVVDGVVTDDRISAIVRSAWDVRADIVIAPQGSLARYDGIVGVRRFTR